MKRFKSQTGSMMMMALFAIGVATAGFTAVGLGQMMWQKREIQKIADMTARTAATQLGDAPAFTQARQVATSNGLANGDTLLFECLAGAGNAVTPCDDTQDGVRVTVTREIRPLFFMAGRTLRAFATAEPSPVIAASITSGLVTLDTAQSDLINAIIGNATGTSVNLNLAGTSGLVTTTANVDILRLSTSLGVLSPGELANLRVGLGTLLDSGRIAAGAPALDLSLKSLLDRINVRVGDLLNLDLTQADAAVGLLNMGDLAVAGLLGSIAGRGIDLKLSNAPTGITTKFYVTEPPRILVARQKRGVRPVGILRGGQIKIEINFEKNATEVLQGLTGITVSNVSALKGGLFIQAGGAQATVNELVCKMPRGSSETRATVQNALFRLCLSTRPANFADTSTTPIVCGAAADVLSFNSNLSITSSVPLLNSLLGIVTGLVNQVTSQAISVSIPAKLDLSGTTNTTDIVLYGKNPDPYRIQNSTGESLTNLLKPPAFRLEVKTNVLGGISLDPLLQPLLDTVTQQLLVNVYNALAPLLGFIGNTVDSILRIPGIAINDAFFDVQRLDCSGTRLTQ